LSEISEIAVAFSGCVTIANICQVRDDVAAAIGQGQSLILDLDAVTETDLTFIQLVEAARLKANDAGCSLKLRRPAAGAVLEVLQRGGFLDDDNSDRARFWLQGAVQ
jgi:MFS superfamily sulfate permease-like transporter